MREKIIIMRKELKQEYEIYEKVKEQVKKIIEKEKWIEEEGRVEKE